MKLTEDLVLQFEDMDFAGYKMPLHPLQLQHVNVLLAQEMLKWVEFRGSLAEPSGLRVNMALPGKATHRVRLMPPQPMYNKKCEHTCVSFTHISGTDPAELVAWCQHCNKEVVSKGWELRE